MEIRKVGVLGCGLMGSGIAQTAATAGFDVTVLEVEQRFIDKGFAGIEKSLGKFAEKGKLKEPAETVRARIKGTTDRRQLADCDIVIEAIIENVQQKREMYASLDGVLKRDGIAFQEAVVPQRRARRPEVEALTDQRRVPVLVIDGQAICDSRRIVEYLEFRRNAAVH